MTLVVAIGCKDGVVLGAESASSDGDSGTKQPFHNKIKPIGSQSILYGGSGDVGLLQKIHDSLAGFQARHSLKRIRQELKKLVVPELKESRELHVPYPQQGFHQPPEATLLFAGVFENRPWILEIEKDGRDTMYGPELGWFAAIGSGKPWAQAIFRPHLGTERDLSLGKVFACRVLEDSIDLAAAFLAKPIHLHSIALDGAILHCESGELQQLGETCELWRALERESVGRLLAPNLESVELPEVPKASDSTVTAPPTAAGGEAF